MRIYTEEAESEFLNLTPMIDVVFLLLIFFLVATRFDQQERELNVALPEVVEAQPLSTTTDLIVNITEDGHYKVDQTEYTEPQLQQLLIENRKKNPQRRVLIRGDGRVPWRYGVRVMGMCNAANIEDYKVAALLEQ